MFFRRAQINPPVEEKKKAASDQESSLGNGVPQKPSSKPENLEDKKTSASDKDSFLRKRVPQKSSAKGEYLADYLDIRSRPHLIKILDKQGDKQVIFADKIFKFTGSGKMKHRTLVITECAIYIIDPETNVLKRRIALTAVGRVCMSELDDNFLAIIIPTEYDLLMASTRKTKIIKALLETIMNTSDYELEVLQSNCFNYQPAANLEKEIQFEEVEGGIKTRVVPR